MTALLYRARIWWPREKLPNERLAPVPQQPRCPIPKLLPESNESVRTIRAIEAQIAKLTEKETTP